MVAEIEWWTRAKLFKGQRFVCSTRVLIWKPTTKLVGISAQKDRS